MLESDIKRRIYSFCTYQERTINDVRKKLSGMDLPQSRIDDLIRELVQENFINEARFVESFVSGKLRINKWGRRKIQLALKTKSLPASLIASGLEKIDKGEYSQIIAHLIATKSRMVKDVNPLVGKNKVARFLLGKGFEAELVWEQINQMEWPPLGNPD